MEHRESEPCKRAMLEAAIDAVITIDHTGRIVEVNAATETVFGHVPESLIGSELGEVIVPASLRAQHRAGLATAEGKIIGRRVETTGLHADGREMPVELTIIRVDVPGPPMYTGYVRDITERAASRGRRRDLGAGRKFRG